MTGSLAWNMCPRTFSGLARSSAMTVQVWRSVLTSSQSLSALPQSSGRSTCKCISFARNIVSSCRGKESHPSGNRLLHKASLRFGRSSPDAESCFQGKTRHDRYCLGDEGSEIALAQSNSHADLSVFESSAHLCKLPLTYRDRLLGPLTGHCQYSTARIIKFCCLSLPNGNKRNIELASMSGSTNRLLSIRRDFHQSMPSQKTQSGSFTGVSHLKLMEPMTAGTSLVFRRDFHHSAPSRKTHSGLNFDVTLLNPSEPATVNASLVIRREFHQSAPSRKTHPGLNIDVALINLAEHGDGSDAQQLRKFKFQGMSLQEMMSLTEKDWEAMVDYRLLSELDVAIYEAHKVAMEKGERFYEDPKTGYVVMTRMAHMKRGTCCGNACRHCPFGHVAVNPALRDKFKFNSAFFH